MNDFFQHLFVPNGSPNSASPISYQISRNTQIFCQSICIERPNYFFSFKSMANDSVFTWRMICATFIRSKQTTKGRRPHFSASDVEHSKVCLRMGKPRKRTVIHLRYVTCEAVTRHPLNAEQTSFSTSKVWKKLRPQFYI